MSHFSPHLTLLVLIISLRLATSGTVEGWGPDTPELTDTWKMISESKQQGSTDPLETFLVNNPSVLKQRSEDGRGALWWAWEFGSAEALSVISALTDVDVFKYDEKDAKGELVEILFRIK
jgi:hypothetical protein